MSNNQNANLYLEGVYVLINLNYSYKKRQRIY